MYYCDATASFFVAKVWGKIFAHFHLVTIKHHSKSKAIPVTGRGGL
jgi:hypothetical protein